MNMFDPILKLFARSPAGLPHQPDPTMTAGAAAGPVGISPPLPAQEAPPAATGGAAGHLELDARSPQAGGRGGILGGLGDRLARGLYGDQAESQRSHAWQDLLSGIGDSMVAGGGQIEAPAQARLGQAERASEREKFTALADAMGLQGRERVVFMLNPKLWAEKNANRFGVRNIAAGSSVAYDPTARGG